jgi:hypothetical protein
VVEDRSGSAIRSGLRLVRGKSKVSPLIIYEPIVCTVESSSISHCLGLNPSNVTGLDPPTLPSVVLKSFEPATPR